MKVVRVVLSSDNDHTLRPLYDRAVSGALKSQVIIDSITPARQGGVVAHRLEQITSLIRTDHEGGGVHNTVRQPRDERARREVAVIALVKMTSALPLGIADTRKDSKEHRRRALDLGLIR